MSSWGKAERGGPPGRRTVPPPVSNVLQSFGLSSKVASPVTRRPRARPGPRPRRGAPAERPRAHGVVLLNKPYGVLCQFTDTAGRRTLADFVPLPGFYAAGRLDADSEGLVVLAADGALIARIADPRHKMPKTYWVELEGIPDRHALDVLRTGVVLDGAATRPAQVRAIAPPAGLWPRDPPVRFRRHLPTSWIEIVLREGRNRQVRRMTAAVGHPTLRLIRWAVGPWTLAGLGPGQWRRARAPATPAPAVCPDPPR